MKNEIFWLVIGAGVGIVLLLAYAVFRGPRLRGGIANAGLMVAAVTVCLVGLEWFLAVRERMPSAEPVVPSQPGAQPQTLPDIDAARVIGRGRSEIVLPPELVAHMNQRRGLLTMPDNFALLRVDATVPCASFAYQWQGVTQIYDQDGYRRCNGPFPEKSADVYRVAVFGDSLTFGAGIENEWTYPSQLQRLMGRDYRIEFINLGAGGAQSEDILQRMKKMVPILKPNLVIYGVCLNDFLPSGVGQYQREWKVPLPDSMKAALKERTRVGRFVSDGYDNILLKLGVSMDFIDDILKDFGNYQTRFGRDLVEMQTFIVRDSGLPPIVGMVLHAVPATKDRGAQLAAAAELWMNRAKFDVISIDDYLRANEGQAYLVSRWDGHPNEEANAHFASMIANHLMDRGDLRAYRKTD